MVPEAEPLLLWRQQGAVLHLRLNRPGDGNALSAPLLAALHRALQQIGADASVRVLVLGAAGTVFCAGHDLHELRDREHSAHYQELFAGYARLLARIRTLPQPVIARVQGLASAAGCQLVAACDLAVASDAAHFAAAGSLPVLPFPMSAVALTRNMGAKPVFEMLVTGALIDAETARLRGLVNRVVPEAQLDAEIDRLAAAILARPARGVAAGKALFYRQQDMGIEAAYQLAAQAMACDLMQAEVQQGLDAFLDPGAPGA
jgi:enoyl-CoA hydratase/carnithine racemase